MARAMRASGFFDLRHRSRTSSEGLRADARARLRVGLGRSLVGGWVAVCTGSVSHASVFTAPHRFWPPRDVGDGAAYRARQLDGPHSALFPSTLQPACAPGAPSGREHRSQCLLPLPLLEGGRQLGGRRRHTEAGWQCEYGEYVMRRALARAQLCARARAD